MGSTTIPTPAATPAAAAPAAAPAPVATPAAAPAAVPTPAAATPAKVPDSKPADKSLTSYFADALEEVRQETGTADTAAEVTAAAEAAPAPAAAAVAEPEPKPAEAAAEPDKPAAAAVPAAVDLDLGESISPSKLSEIFKAAPAAVQEWINDPANADMKNAMYAMAKRSDKAREILDVIPDKKTADQMVQVFDKFEDFDTGFEAVSNVESGTEFWRKVYEDFAITGADGKKQAHPAFGHLERAITKANMDYVVEMAERSGKIHPVLGDIFNRVLGVVEKQAKTDDNGELLAAISAIRETNGPAFSQPQVELTEGQKKKDAELRERETAVNSRDRAALETKVTSAKDTANQTAASSAVDQILPLLEKSNLSQLEHKNAVQEIGARLEEALKAMPVYTRTKSRLEAAIAKNPSEEAQRALAEHIISWQNMKLGQIATEVIRDVTAGRVKRSGDKQEKIAAQVDASKTEPAGAGSGAAAPQQLTEQQWEAEDRKEWEKTDKRVPFLTFTMDRALKRMGGQA